MPNEANYAAHPETFGLTPNTEVPAAPSTYDYVGGNPELDQLLAVEDALYVEAADLERRQKEIKDRIKVALTSVTRPVSPNVDTPFSPQPYERYRIAVAGAAVRVLRWKVSRRIDSTRLKREQPGLYAAYSKSSGAWYLEREK